MARKCGKCGIEGHNARSCSSTEEEIMDAEHQASLEIPKKLHLGGAEIKNYLCGEKKKGWPSRCTTDAFAKSLPLCEGCVEIWKEMNPNAATDFLDNWN
jgi:hypothetical protein